MPLKIPFLLVHLSPFKCVTKNVPYLDLIKSSLDVSTILIFQVFSTAARNMNFISLSCEIFLSKKTESVSAPVCNRIGNGEIKENVMHDNVHVARII